MKKRKINRLFVTRAANQCGKTDFVIECVRGECGRSAEESLTKDGFLKGLPSPGLMTYIRLTPAQRRKFNRIVFTPKGRRKLRNP